VTQFFRLRHATMSECVNCRDFRIWLENSQTRQMGSKSDYLSLFGGGKMQNMSQPLDVSLSSLTEVPDAKPIFADACAWLSEMALVGITERYTETVILTCELLGIAPPRQAPQANVNPQRANFITRYRQQLDPAIVAQLEEMNGCDNELYAYGCELFEQQWSRYQARPRRTYSLAPRLRYTRARARRLLHFVKQFVKRSLLWKKR
jgi:hypothetical protein